MIGKALGVLACVALSFNAFAAALDFKGIVLDQPATPQLIADKLHVKCGEGTPGMQVCNGFVTVGGVGAQLNLVIGVSGKVQRIALDFDADDFAAVESAMIQKFGAPESAETSVVQNRMGARFDQTVDRWGTAPEPAARLARYSAVVTRGSLVFRSEEDRQLLRRINAGNPNDI